MTESVKDRLWIWGHPTNSHYSYSEFSPEIARSRMTPAEAAGYLGVPNLLMVRYANHPLPPFDQYAMPLAPLKRVVWSILSAIDLSTGRSESEHLDLDAVLDIARKQENLCGVVLDDFFGRDGHEAALSVEQLQDVRKKLSLKDRQLDIWAVYYDRLSGKTPPDSVVEPYLRSCDVVNYWTWKAADLSHLEAGMAEARGIADRCGCRVVLGCYMFDYGGRRPMPVELMEKQCRQGLEWLREGSIDGMVFLASCICDLGLEAVEWTRNWIGKLD